MPETPVWKIPYPDRGTNPDIPRDLQAIAEKIDTIDLDTIADNIPPRTALSFMWVDDGSGPPGWKKIPEIWHYNENLQRWDRHWYGPRIPHFYPPMTVSPSRPMLGDVVTVTGGVVDQFSNQVQEGTVVLMRQDIARSGWREVARTQLGPGHLYTLTDPGITIVGTVFYRVDYIAPDIRFEDRQNVEYSFSVGVPQVSGLRYVTFAHDHVELEWDAINGADGYEIYEDGALVATVARTTSGRIDIIPGAVPHWKVRAFKNDANGNAVYGPFSDELYVVDTVTTFTTQPKFANAGDSYTVAGTVQNIAGDPVQVGQIELQHRQTSSGNWRAGPRIDVVNGAWTYSSTYQHVGDGLQFRAVYHPPAAAAEQTSEALSTTVNVGMRTVGTLSTGSSSHTSCSISWAKVPSATRYQIGNGTTVISGGTLGDVSSKTISLSQNTNYAWRVRAGRQDENGTWIYGGWSPILNFNGGRPEVRKTGTKSVRCDPVWTTSYSRTAGWNAASGSDRVYQGYYSSSYGGAGYFGVAYYGDVYAKVRSAVGSSVDMSKVTVTRCRVWAHRNSGVGHWGGARTATFTSSDCSSKSGGDPSGQWQATSKSIPAAPWWGAIELGARFGEEFVKYKHKSICIRRHNSNDYMGFNGKSSGSSDWDMVLDVKWDYVSQARIAPRWWR